MNSFPRTQLAYTLGKKLRTQTNSKDSLINKINSMALLIVDDSLPEAIFFYNDNLLVTTPNTNELTLIKLLAQIELKHFLLPDNIRNKSDSEINIFCQGYGLNL